MFCYPTTQERWKHKRVLLLVSLILINSSRNGTEVRRSCSRVLRNTVASSAGISTESIRGFLGGRRSTWGRDHFFDPSPSALVPLPRIASVEMPAEEARNTGWWGKVWNTYSYARFKKLFRVSRGTFLFILGRIRHDLVRDTVCEEPISPECRRSWHMPLSWLCVQLEAAAIVLSFTL